MDIDTNGGTLTSAVQEGGLLVATLNDKGRLVV